jgi:DNA-binding response OmpR family regulator
MKILVIDDDPLMADAIKIFLSPLGAEVTDVYFDEHGIQLAKQYFPDITILDINDNDNDVAVICNTLCSFSNSPLLVLSPFDSPGFIANALDSGADDYLIKPISANTLILHIQNLLKRKAPRFVPVQMQVSP